MRTKAVILSVLVCLYSGYDIKEHFKAGYDWPTTYEGIKLLAIEKTVMLCDAIGLDSPSTFRSLLKLVYGSSDLSPDPEVDFDDVMFDGVTVRVYSFRARATDRLLPAVVIYHGGGWTISSIDDIHRESLRLARELQAVVVSVGYRLAPENKCPVPFQDCLIATKYFLSNARSFRVDPERIALKGLSSGGTLAAGVALALKNEAFVPQPKLVVVVNAMLQAITLNTPSYQYNQYDAFMTRSVGAWFLGNYLFASQKYYYALLECEYNIDALPVYLRHTMSRDSLPDDTIRANHRPVNKVEVCQGFYAENEQLLFNQYAFPLMAENLTKMQPFHIYTCYNDVLRDDGIRFAQRLRHAGNGDIKEFHLQDCHHLWNVFHEFDSHNSKLYSDLIENIARDL